MELTFSEKQVRDVDPDTLVRARMDPQWIISGVMYDAIADVLKEGDGGFATLFALLGVVQCEQDLGHDLISRPQAVAASVASSHVLPTTRILSSSPSSISREGRSRTYRARQPC